MANAVYKDDASMEGLWLLEETSGTRYDYTGNDNDLTDNNTVGSSTDSQEGDRSADFESGNNEYLEITDGDQSGLDITGAMSICLWLKPESFPGDMFLVGKYNTGSSQRGYMLWLDDLGTTGQPYFYVSSDGSSTANVSGDTALSASTWYHLVATYDGSYLRIYLDGSLDCTPVSYSSGIYDCSSAFRLGRHPEDIWPYDGLMDEVAVLSRALSADEISYIHTYGFRDTSAGRLVNNPARLKSLVGGKLA